MNKEEFLKIYRDSNCPKILLGAFNEQGFLDREDLELKSGKIKISELGDFYCPWYYIDDHEADFYKDLEKEKTRAIKVSDKQKINLVSKRQNIIEQYQKEQIESLGPIPVATDTATGKTLILDSNRTLVSLYRNFLKDGLDKDILIIEIRGANLEDVVGDFKIVNR